MANRGQERPPAPLVEPEVRAQLVAHRMLSWRVFLVRGRAPGRILTAVAGLGDDARPADDRRSVDGPDPAAQRSLGLECNADALRALRSRLVAATGLADDTDVRDVIVRTHQRLVEAPSVLVAAALEDALAVDERPNLPATTSAEWPNWYLALLAPLEALEHERGARAIANTLGRGRGRWPRPSPGAW